MLYVAEHLGLIPDDLLARSLAVSIVDASEMMRDDVFYGSFFKRTKLRKHHTTSGLVTLSASYDVKLLVTNP